ncbi:MAG: penicillin-binding protein 1C [Roseivirga sp.]
MKKYIIKYRYHLLVLLSGLSIGYYFSLPRVLFDDPYASILNAKNGELLSARIAKDGQWRFPLSVSVPEKYEQALITFEDKNFRKHPGVDVLALARATRQNILARKVVSGGSTVSMQVIRLHRKGKSRNIAEKLIEMVLATRLELRYTKDEILNLYASHAPFGGNTVGLEAAAWRYFGREASELSWAEAALLAVLPNQPSLLFPGRNNAPLKAKRDRLLDRLHEAGHFDAYSLELAKAEPIPARPHALPMQASHLLDRSVSDGHGQQKLGTTLDYHLQSRVNKVVRAHHELLRTDEIHNAAALVIDVRKGEVMAYTGNAPGAGFEHGQDVDIVRAPRSTGSLLKPMLYASVLDDGLILPSSLIPDVPVFFGGFAPRNFSRTYDGAVHANTALSRSLNIPAVHLLKQYGYGRFHQKLRDVGVTTLNRPASHYGLSLILGGSEGTLWDMANVYAGMARTLNSFGRSPSPARYASTNYRPAEYRALSEAVDQAPGEPENHLSAAAIWFTFKAMLEVYRPDEDAAWKLYGSSQQIAWKTGTSFGFRDGWAIGVTPDHVVAVWVGNADGEGRPGLTGIKAAAPIMFDIFDLLPQSDWFNEPMDELTYAAVDRESGYLASTFSNQVDTVLIPKSGLQTAVSPFHQRVHLDKTASFRVTGACESVNSLISKNWFVLPPKQAFYYKRLHPTYQELPPMRSDCYSDADNLVVMDMLYPEPDATLYIPTELSGVKGEVVFEVAHRDADSQLHWHLDDHYVGTTVGDHQLNLQPPGGDHILTVTDNEGNSLKRSFTVLEKEGD